ncbi:Hypothetical predicted protein [Octopus vulgaris]|uniref:Uncharacterized protein n=1 Tax=Octopus vulgaris TaxID=6645 RepID=A0AA36F6C2_OCTVU|nr:Hypothetical predicted protein [Octopus vulgaris]
MLHIQSAYLTYIILDMSLFIRVCCDGDGGSGDSSGGSSVYSSKHVRFLYVFSKAGVTVVFILLFNNKKGNQRIGERCFLSSVVSKLHLNRC